MKKIILAFTLALGLLAGCGQNTPTPPVVVPQAASGAAAAPVIVQQQSDNSTMSALLGGLAGYMLGSSGSRQPAYAPAPQVVERHHFYRVEPRKPAEPAKQAAAAPEVKPATPTPTPAAPAASAVAKVPQYGSPPAPKPTVTYNGFSSSSRSVSTPSKSYSAPSFTSRPGSYSRR